MSLETLAPLARDYGDLFFAIVFVVGISVILTPVLLWFFGE